MNKPPQTFLLFFLKLSPVLHRGNQSVWWIHVLSLINISWTFHPFFSESPFSSRLRLLFTIILPFSITAAAPLSPSSPFPLPLLHLSLRCDHHLSYLRWTIPVLVIPIYSTSMITTPMMFSSPSRNSPGKRVIYEGRKSKVFVLEVIPYIFPCEGVVKKIPLTFIV